DEIRGDRPASEERAEDPARAVGVEGHLIEAHAASGGARASRRTKVGGVAGAVAEERVAQRADPAMVAVARHRAGAEDDGAPAPHDRPEQEEILAAARGRSEA